MSTKTITDAVAMVRRSLYDTAADTSERLMQDVDITAYVNAAEARYSVDRPLVMVEDVNADGTEFSDLPASWDADFSTLRYIEHPVGETPPSIRDARIYSVWNTPSGSSLAWLDSWYPSDGDTVRYAFTVPRSFAADAADTTIPDRHFAAVCDLAVHYAAAAIAAKYASTHEPVLGADTASYRTKQQEWDTVSRRALDRYRAALTNMSTPASGRINWDLRGSTGDNWLTHGRRYR